MECAANYGQRINHNGDVTDQNNMTFYLMNGKKIILTRNITFVPISYVELFTIIIKSKESEIENINYLFKKI
jgi:hypothetical protein